MQLIKMQGMSQLNNSLSRSDDCSFNEGYLDDCSDDGDCCPVDWVGDELCDGPDQEFGCDLSCYSDSEGNISSPGDNNFDGGDCAEGDVVGQNCMPQHPCYNISDATHCENANCVWKVGDSETEFNGCHPEPVFGADQCGMLNQTGCIAAVGLCMWEINPPPDSPADWEEHCKPYQADCYQFDSQNIGACEDSPFCEWNPPEHIEEWANGACMSFDPCISWFNEIDCLDQIGLHPDIACQWDNANYECAEAVDDSGSFCDCRIAHTKSSCDDMNTDDHPHSWEPAPWCDGDDGCDEKVCMVPMKAHDCSYEHFEFEDPCAESTENVHLNIDWDGETCRVIKSRDNSGLWDVTGGQFCVAFPYEPDPDCEDIDNPDECYCYNCMFEWDATGASGECKDNIDGEGERVKRLEQERNYQNVMYSLSNSCSDADLLHYEPMTFSYSYPVTWEEKANSIYLWSVDPDNSDACTEVILVPVGEGL
jgi:hypothetical protein